MLCTKCNKNKATVYFKQNINGEIREYALCSECAAEAELGFSPLNYFGALHGMAVPMREEKKCTLCSSTFDEIRKSGKVGCAECYSVFEKELRPMLESIHRGAVHVGRTVEGDAVKPKVKNDLDGLRKELQTAIEQENYERAAELRDIIREKEAKND